MSVIVKMRKQTAVYWPPDDGGFDKYGRPTVGTAEELTVRWEDVMEEFLDADGNTQMSMAKVYTGQDVELGGYLWLGELTDLTDQVDPRNNNGAFEIMRFEKLPTFKATEYLRTAFLGGQKKVT